MLRSDLSLILRKLGSRCPLSSADRDSVTALPFLIRTVPAATYLLREGEPPIFCSFLLSGFAFRHKIVANGGRQIVSLHIPGEALDFQGLFLDCADHNIQTLTAATLAVVPMAALQQLMMDRPAIARAILMDLTVESSIFREWIANVGRRDARTRLAHLLCEFVCRLDAKGLKGDSYELPMTQEQLGDALGLTSVHVNRSIRLLESEGLIRRNKRTLSFPDIDRLRNVGDFGTLYLHHGLITGTERR